MKRTTTISSLLGAAALTLALTACGGDDAGGFDVFGNNGGFDGNQNQNQGNNNNFDGNQNNNNDQNNNFNNNQNDQNQNQNNNNNNFGDNQNQNDNNLDNNQDQGNNNFDNSTSNNSGGNASEYCRLMAQSDDLLLNLDPMSDAGRIVDTFRTIANVAPPEVAADWNRFIEVMELIDDIDVRDPEVMDKINSVDDIVDVGNRIQQHAMIECM
jgi:hypothetical protein